MTLAPESTPLDNTGSPIEEPEMEPQQITPDELRQRMDALGFTAYRLAKELGVTTQAVYYWLAGERVIPAMLDRALRDVEREHAP